MPYDLLALFGSVRAPEELRLPKLREIVRYAASPDAVYVTLCECRQKEDNAETVILDLRVELAQRPQHPIKPVERVAITVSPNDTTYPEVVSLRDDFPQVTHLNFRSAGTPKSFCLYAESYPELKLHWTAHRMVERIRAWLAKTADGNLHPGDQPLEPLVSLAHGILVVPDDLPSGDEAPMEPYYVASTDPETARSVWVLWKSWPERSVAKTPTHVAVSFRCPAHTHGLIASVPTDLAELDAFLSRVNFDLIGELQKRFAHWKSDSAFKKLGAAKLIVILHLPKRRLPTGPVEHIERVAFLCGRPLAEVEVQLTNFRLAQQHSGIIVIPEAVRDRANIPLLPFEVTSQFSPRLAAVLSGTPEESRNFCAFGAGALGSQILDTLFRSGFGRWTIIDEDRLLPHNLARHQLTGSFVGHRKSSAAAQVANDLFQDPVATSIVANLLDEETPKPELKDAIQASAAVLDCTASVPVARRLAAGELGTVRGVSLFLNPAGEALVLLAEDADRSCRLDWLEMQYYRSVVREPGLANHLRTVSQTRYSNACRSLTSRVSPESVAMFAAIGSRAFRESVTSGKGTIAIWQTDSSMRVGRIDIVAESVVVSRIGEWTICSDRQLLGALGEARASHLPKETGGVLVGSYDMHRRILYIVDMLPSPPDSEEWPTSYRRGSAGLRQRLTEISECTLQNLEYVGEWHSHPDCCGVGPSSLDIAALQEISVEMGKTGLPGVMLIIGTEGQYAFYLGESV